MISIIHLNILGLDIAILKRFWWVSGGIYENEDYPYDIRYQLIRLNEWYEVFVIK
jgi:hypothetical protein